MWTAMADPTRRVILARVIDRPSPVQEIARGLPMTLPNVSQHLRVLREAGLVEVRAEGTRRIYSPRWEGLAAFRSEVATFWGGTLDNFAARLDQERPEGDQHDPAAASGPTGTDENGDA
jgi:DNA-binding transcriptional ArsR family regulator